MNAKIKQNWIDALRSGNYPQATARLRTLKGFCCLGVLCDLYQKEHPNKCDWNLSCRGKCYDFVNYDTPDYDTPDNITEDSLYLPEEVMLWADLDDDNPAIVFNSSHLQLSDVNDMGTSFKEIANLIENQL